MDEQQLNVTLEVAKEVAKSTYEDVAHPALKPTGEILGLVPRAVRAAILPLEKWIVGREYNLAETKKLLDIKLQNVAPEKISPPEAHIGVPALQYISYCMDSEELRDMYAELLAKSMNEATRGGVHPSFVEIIKQLCPDEAKIIKFIDEVIPVIALRYQNNTGQYIEVLRNFSDVGERAKCECPGNTQRYIENMERLGLIATVFGESIAGEGVYEALENHPMMQSFMARKKGLEETGYFATINKGLYRLTSFGHSFIVTCIAPITEQKAGDHPSASLANNLP